MYSFKIYFFKDLNRGESLPSSDGFPSLSLSQAVPVIRADLN